MGKSLKGRELGEGISQQKDGLYVARYTAIDGKRVSKRFKELKDCKEWFYQADILLKKNVSLKDITVNELARMWLKEKEKILKYRTWKSYESTYRMHIEPFLGELKLCDVKMAHCKNTIYKASEELKNGTLERIKSVMCSLFSYAIENELIEKNPASKVVTKIPGNEGKEVKALTREEQNRFIQCIKGTRYENSLMLILNTGLRISELCGLKWQDIDFQNKTMKIQRTAIEKIGSGIVEDTTKSVSGNRLIPLTDEAIRILKSQKARTKVINIDTKDYVFTSCYGNITNKRNYDAWIEKHRDEWGLPNLTPHVLRHTFATRCIEGGMIPKTLQMILGHSNISVTMNLYVHTTEEQKAEEIKQVENLLKIVV